MVVVYISQSIGRQFSTSDLFVFARQQRLACYKNAFHLSDIIQPALDTLGRLIGNSVNQQSNQRAIRQTV